MRSIRQPIIVFATLLLVYTDLHACDGSNGIDNFIWSFFLAIVAGMIGYIVGTVKSFREEKQKAYSEIIPPILKMAYNPQDTIDEKEYSKALSRLWLYGSKKVTQRMEHALEILHHPSKKEDITKALQKAVVEMRRDIQLSSWQNIKPEDVKHLYTRISGTNQNNDKNA